MVKCHVQELVTGCTGLWFNVMCKSWLQDALDNGSMSCTRVGYRMHWIMVQFHVQELVTGCTGLWFNFMYKSWLQDALDYGSISCTSCTTVG